MVVHMIRILCHHPDNLSMEQVDAEVRQWVDSHPEWFEDPVPHHVTSVQAGEVGSPGTQYLRGDFRFEWESRTAAELLDTLEADLTGTLDWWRIGHHACTHDEATTSGCVWGTEREYGPIPSDIPDLY